jgi:hypothetical protein
MEGFFTSKWTITTSFRFIGSNKPGFLTNFYSPATPGDKEAFLHHLEWIANHIGNHQWILGGDFNMITSLEEKKGGTRRLGNDSEQFHRIIILLNLIDIGIDNGPFTWSTRHSGEQHVSCRLDRFLISEPVMLDGLTWNSTMIDTPRSDHWLILLSINISGTPGRKPFRFEKLWLTHLDFQANINLWWKEEAIKMGTPMYKFQQKLKNLKKHLKSCNKSTFGNIFHAQEILNQQIQYLQSQIKLQGFTKSLKEQESILNK